MTPPILRPLSVGEILDTSFSLYRRHFAALATVSLICTVAKFIAGEPRNPATKRLAGSL